MGDIRSASPGLLLLAAFSRHAEAIQWARHTCEAAWGPVALASLAFDFCETDYYRTSMGEGLRKQFFVFDRPFDPADLADCKLQTNRWEAEYAGRTNHPESRPLNLDPGYLTLAKLVLASTKDHAHRIYLQQGIYAEITLKFRAGGWQPTEWTYPDYRRADFQEFFTRSRECLKRRSQ
ncbi:MAG: DUF4416 family protein [Pirellulales bacterium]|nr:DUF4416 family protein [Pirellulales bacterium]